MKIVYTIIVLCFGITTVSAQGNPLPQFIKKTKPCVVAIIAFDDSIVKIEGNDTLYHSSRGSGVVIFYSGKTSVLTNEHIVAVKNNKRETVRYMKKIGVLCNTVDKGIMLMPARINKVDADKDSVLLDVYSEAPKEELDVKFIQESLWKEPSEFNEGDKVMYLGYPYNWGFDKKNYPLSRQGIVSQIIPGKPTFLIDGFVQSGYSGSPVFLISENTSTIPTSFDLYFIGIACAYPDAYQNLYRVKFEEIPDMVAKENPGFAVVIGINTIREFLK